ncbi:helix-turn-helix transcriptional regulator [Mycobacterium sp. URHB0044]|uniref:helix-turn-helix transcriptional regulator n=1 Tax=Mycobacterium sp. URHB0044 TaxID=1380386 RepID=UPI000490D55F|nr:helix-turn-helix transcriptional regulator [Mycobacterium sp. URHB0044]
MTTRYLSRSELAERIGVKPDTLGRYRLPEPDALIGTTRGWLPKTIDRWNDSRPGRGFGGGRPRKSG